MITVTGTLRTVLAAVVALTLTACADDDERSPTEQAAARASADVPEETPERTELQRAADDCATTDTYVRATDQGHTLLVDHKGEDDIGGASLDDVACVLARLDTPEAVIARMDATRALDGRQEASWDGYLISWTYHPDSGLDLIIEDS